MGGAESTNYQELLEGQFVPSAAVDNDTDNFRILPPDVVHGILYHLEVNDLGAFTQTSKYNMSLVTGASSFWINLAQEKYWDDLGALEEPGEKSPLFFRDKFRTLHSTHLDIRFPIRVSRRQAREQALIEGKSSLLADIWYFFGLSPFWEGIFFFSLLFFFLLLPVYLDEMIPGFERIHIMLLLIIPFIQVMWNAVLSIPVSIWAEFRESELTNRVPMGSLMISSMLPFYGARDSGTVYLVVSASMAGGCLWLGLLIMNTLEWIPYYTVSFAVLWCLYFIPGLVIAYKLAETMKIFDLGYFFVVGASLGIFLIMIPLYIDGFVTFHLAWVFFPLFWGEFMLALTPFVAMWMDCCNVNWSDMGSSGDTCCVFLIVFWPPVLIFVVMEALTIIIVENDIGYWTCIWIPFYILLCGAIVLWPILYHGSLEHVNRRPFLMDYIEKLRE